MLLPRSLCFTFTHPLSDSLCYLTTRLKSRASASSVSYIFSFNKEYYTSSTGDELGLQQLARDCVAYPSFFLELYNMECGWKWEQKTLINELKQGMELAKQLRFHLSSASSVETREFLVQRILSSYEKALLVLNCSGSAGQPRPAAEPVLGMPESPISVNGSPSSEEFNRSFKDQQDRTEVSKKRKLLPRWMDRVRVSAEAGLEGPQDDGYSWRKYGQKDILGARFPRSYYRCTYRSIRDCWATKQVQRSDEDPSIFEITYRGKHTCTPDSNSIPAQAQAQAQAQASPEKHEQKQNSHLADDQQLHSGEILLNFQSDLRVDTENWDNHEMASPFSFQSASLAHNIKEITPSMLENNSFAECYSPPFVSPATSESNHLSVSPFRMHSSGGVHNFQHSESDAPETISANTSATNSPILDLDLDFSLDPVDFGNFPFDTSGFFS